MTKNNLLDKVNYPVDLKKFSIDELKQLTKDLREELIDVVSTTGGHLGSWFRCSRINCSIALCV